MNNATEYWKEAVKPCREYGIPWTIVFGNHDDLSSGSDGTRRDLMKFDREFALSLSQFGPQNIHGVSNYFLEVFPSDSEAQNPVSILYFLDSGGGSYPNVSVFIKFYKH